MRVCRLPAPGVQAVEVTRESSFLFLKSRPPGTNSPLPWAADTHGSSRQQGLWPHPCTYSLTPLGSSGQAWERMSEVLVRAGKVLGRPAADHGRPHQGQEGMSEMFILSDISSLTQLCLQCFASILPSTLPLSPFFREKHQGSEWCVSTLGDQLVQLLVSLSLPTQPHALSRRPQLKADHQPQGL